MKVNRLGDVVYTDKNLPAEKMKDYFIHRCKYITNSIIQEDKPSFSFVKGIKNSVFYFCVNYTQVQSCIMSFKNKHMA